jgi:hypothetical protein
MNGSLSIMDIKGDEVIKTQFNGGKINLDISNFPKSVYLIKVISEGKSAVCKFIKE